MYEERSHLLLVRREGESLIIGEVTVTIHEIQRGRVRLGVRAPRGMPIYRNEVLEAMRDSVRPRAHEESEIEQKEGEARKEPAPGQEGEGGGS